MSDVTGVADGFIAGAAVSTGGLCTPWLTVTELRPGDCTVCQGVTDETPSDDVLEAAIVAASEYLNAQAGFQFPGVCETTVRPCDTNQNWGPWQLFAPIPYVLPNGFWPLWGGCGCSGGCNCCGPRGFALGRIPIVSVSEVKLDGEVLTEDVDWTLVDNLLIRLDPDDPEHEVYWPSCRNSALPDTELNTFSVTFSYGAGPPSLGVLAATDLACVLVRAQCGDASCKPAQRMVQKVAGGTTVQLISPDGDISTALPDSVKLFLKAFSTGFRLNARMRRPGVGSGVIVPTPEMIGGTPWGRYGLGLGAACQGCS